MTDSFFMFVFCKLIIFYYVSLQSNLRISPVENQYEL